MFQPLFTYFGAIRDAQSIKVDTTVSFDTRGMLIRVLEHRQNISWKNFVPDEKGKGMVILRKPMLVVIPDQLHAYLIPNRAFGTEEKKRNYMILL